MTQKHPTTKPLFATVGAGDAVYSAVHDAVSQVRDRAGSADVSVRVDEARERVAHLPADVQTQFESLRERMSGLPAELPDDLAEIRDRLTPEELRRLADQYYRQALDVYSELVDRGADTVDRLRTNQAVDEQFDRVENLYKDAADRAEDVVDRFNELLGRTAESIEPGLGTADSGSTTADAADVQDAADAAGDAAPIVDAEFVDIAADADRLDPADNGQSQPGTAAGPVPGEPGAKKTTAKKAPTAKKTAAKKAQTKKSPPNSV